MFKRTLAVLLFISVLAVSGCGSVVPKLSEEEREMVSEYAAALLLKYDSQNHSRLVDTTEFMDTYNAALAAREESIKQYELEKERKRQEKEEARIQAEKDALAAQATESHDDGTGGATIINGGGNTQPQMTIAEYFQAPDFSITYAGYDVVSRYPEDSSAPISASAGKDLLVLYFNTYSENGGRLDIYSHYANFKISVNKSAFSSNYMTVLEDDLSQYIGDFSAGETKRLAVFFEVPQGVSISTLDLSLDGIDYDTEVLTLME